MNPTMRAIGLLVLVAFTCGCSTARLAAWPHDRVPEGADATARPVVAAGDRVTVELLDGSTVRGRVLQVTGEFLTLDTANPSTGVGDDVLAVVEIEPRTIPRDTVRTLKMDMADGEKTVLLVIGLAGVVGGIVVMTKFELMSGPLWGSSTSGR